MRHLPYLLLLSLLWGSGAVAEPDPPEQPPAPPVNDDQVRDAAPDNQNEEPPRGQAPLAQITTRSQVEVRVRNGAGTSGPRLRAMVSAVTAQVGSVRGCYREISSERLDIFGEIEVAVRAPAEGEQVALTVRRNTVDHRPLLQCVQEALSETSIDGIERPAEVVLKFTFHNSSSQGNAPAVNQPEVELEEVDGQLVSHGSTVNGKVRFDVLGGTDHGDRIRAVHRVVRHGIAGILDCRRRANRSGMNSEGSLQMTLVVPWRGAIRVQHGSSTVEDERAARCVSRVLRHSRFPDDARGRTALRFHFTGREQEDS